jgi:RHS repeat-associated protein
MCPGIAVAGGGGDGGGGSGGSGKKGKGKKGAGKKKGKKGAKGGKKGAKKGKKGGANGGCGKEGGKCPGSHGGKKGKKGRGDPVDVSTGRVFTDPADDLVLNGPLLFLWTRTYSSAVHDRDVGLGPGWSFSYGVELEVVRQQVWLWADDGTLVEYDLPKVGDSVPGENGLTLRREPWGFTLRTGHGVQLQFSVALDGGRRYLLGAVQERNGHRITLVYRNDLLIEIVDSAQRRIAVARDSKKHISSLTVQTPDGRVFPMRTYEYHPDGTLARTVDADGHAEWFEYCEHGLTKWKDSSGLTYHFQYLDDGRCFETWGDYDGAPIIGLSPNVPAVLADGTTPARGFNHVRINYFPDGSSEVIDSTIVQRYDENDDGNVDRAVSGGAVFARTFDDLGNETTLQYPDMATERWDRDSEGRIVAYTDPVGRTTRYQYDANGQLFSVQRPDGGVFEYRYDRFGNIAEIHCPGGVWTFEYTNGFLTRRVDPDGSEWRGDWDAQGNLVGVVDPVGNRWSATYDPLGGQSSRSDPMGGTIEFQYTPAGRGYRETYPDGSSETYLIDGALQLRELIASDGRTIRQLPGIHRQAVEQMAPDGQVTRYFYDRENRLVEVLSAAGRSHRYRYDGNDFVLSETTFDGRTLHYRWGPTGQPSRFLNGDGRAIDFEYDADSQLVLRSTEEGETAYEYDLNGFVQRVTTDSVVTEFERDAFGRMVRERRLIDGVAYSVEATWNGSHSVAELRTSLGHVRSYEYDRSGLMAAITLDSSDRIKFAYDARGCTTHVTLPNGGEVDILIDGKHRLARSTVRRRTGVLTGPEWVGLRPDIVAETSYHYGHCDEPLRVDDTTAGSTELRYDASLRLLAVDGKLPERFAYTADGHASSVGAHCEYDAGGRPTRVDDQELSWDACGRLVERKTPAGTWSYEWSTDDELTKVVRPDESTIEYLYDRTGKLVRKRTKASGGASADEIFVWWGDELVHVVREQGTLTFVYGTDGFTPMAQRAGGDAWSYFVPGPAPQTRRLVDGKGEIISDVPLTAYGAAVGPSDLTPLRFPGQIWDDDAQLSYNQARFYDPTLRQYISPDPLGLLGGLTPFAYAKNSPTAFCDPQGLKPPASRTCLYGSDGKPLATGNSGVVHGPPPKTPHHPTVEAALGPAKPLYKGGGHPCGSCGEPNAFSSLLQGVPPSGAAAKLDSVASVIIIQCTPGKRNKPKSGEAKAPCRFCQKMLPELKDPSGKGMDQRIGLPAGGKSAAELQSDCKSSGGCKGK